MVDLEKIKCPAGEELYWYGCYEREIRFKKYLHPDTFAHPAKMSLPLADRIFKHLNKLGLIKEGDTVIDFMAGSSRTGIIASMHDCKFIGVELEPHFVEMSEKNRQQVEKRLGRKVDWQIIQGDSRKLSEILNKGGAGIVSPPYSEAMSGGGINKKGYKGKYGEDPNIVDRIWSKENLTAQRKRIMNGKAKMQRPDAIMNESNIAAKGYFEASYSSNPQNIGNLKDKPLIGIVSPPYQAGIGDFKNKREDFVAWIQNELKTKGYIEWNGQRYTEKEWRQKNYGRIDGRVMVGSPKMGTEGYNPSNPSNIGNLKDKPLIGVVSPPYQARIGLISGEEHVGHLGSGSNYSFNLFNIGNQQEDSYLQAMFQVYSEAFRSGISPLVVVTKNPTRDGALRRLDLDTIQLITNCHKSLFCQCDD